MLFILSKNQRFKSALDTQPEPRFLAAVRMSLRAVMVVVMIMILPESGRRRVTA